MTSVTGSKDDDDVFLGNCLATFWYSFERLSSSSSPLNVFEASVEQHFV